MMRFRSLAAITFLVGIGATGGSQSSAASQELVKYSLAPAHADSTVHRFTAPNYVVFEKGTASSAPLLVFMPGTQRSTKQRDELCRCRRSSGLPGHWTGVQRHPGRDAGVSAGSRSEM